MPKGGLVPFQAIWLLRVVLFLCERHGAFDDLAWGEDLFYWANTKKMTKLLGCYVWWDKQKLSLFLKNPHSRAGTPLACWATPWALVLLAFMPPPSPSTSRLSSCWTWSNRSVGGWTSSWRGPGTRSRWDSTRRRRPALSLRRFTRPMRRPWRGC